MVTCSTRTASTAGSCSMAPVPSAAAPTSLLLVLLLQQMLVRSGLTSAAEAVGGPTRRRRTAAAVLWLKMVGPALEKEAWWGWEGARASDHAKREEERAARRSCGGRAASDSGGYLSGLWTREHDLDPIGSNAERVRCGESVSTPPEELITRLARVQSTCTGVLFLFPT